MALLDVLIGPVLEIINKVIPDPAAKAAAQFKVLELQQSSEFKVLEAQLASAKAQTDINLEEAKSPSLFKSGARPAILWTGAVGMFYQWLVVPLSSFAYTTYSGHALPVPPPSIDPNLFLLIGSLLGVGIGARTFEKIKGVAT